MNHCSVCNKEFDSESPDILTFSQKGSPRLICENCKDLYVTATKSHDPDEAENALQTLRTMLAECDDLAVLELCNEEFPAAEKRIAAIRDGSYDFSDDATDTEAEPEIPEELRESEEDKKAYAEAEERLKHDTLFDKITTGLWIVAGCVAVAAVIFTVIKIIF